MSFLSARSVIGSIANSTFFLAFVLLHATTPKILPRIEVFSPKDECMIIFLPGPGGRTSYSYSQWNHSQYMSNRNSTSKIP